MRYFFETSSPLEAPTYIRDLERDPNKKQRGGGRPRRLGIGLSEMDYSFSAKERPNPFLLPWSLRGMMDDRAVQSLFGKELKRLKEEFEEWRPVSKVLKDLKMRLEPLKSVFVLSFGAVFFDCFGGWKRKGFFSWV